MPPKYPTKKQPIRKAKRARGEPSNEPEIDFSLGPRNRFLFRDDEAYRQFVSRFHKRKLSDCFYFDPKGQIGARYLNKINGWIDHFSLRTMTGITTVYSEFTTRLFYANIRFNNLDNASSYFHGKTIDLSFLKLAELLDMPNDGNMIYPHKSWPWDSDNEVCTVPYPVYRRWFGWGTRTDMYVTDIPALHRVTHLLVNNILTPKLKIKTNIEKGALFFMKHMIDMDEFQFNIPYVLISHMLKAHSNNKDSLPYGHLIHFLLKAQEIENLLLDISESDHKQPKNILDYFSGWIKEEGMLVPNPDDPRNGYLKAEGAAPNQYHPLSEDAPEPEPEPQLIPEPVPPPQAQAGNLDHLMTFLTNQVQGMNQRLDKFETNVNERYDRIET